MLNSRFKWLSACAITALCATVAMFLYVHSLPLSPTALKCSQIKPGMTYHEALDILDSIQFSPFPRMGGGGDGVISITRREFDDGLVLVHSSSGRVERVEFQPNRPWWIEWIRAKILPSE